MSYGWLTESALLPQPSKKINVDKSSVRSIVFQALLIYIPQLVDLSVMLEKEKKKRQGKEMVHKFSLTIFTNIKQLKAPTKKIFVDTNKGVEARNRKDLEASTQEVIDGQARLQEKVKIYEAMSNTKINSFIDDFASERTNR